jgi:hypothetical protein
MKDRVLLAVSGRLMVVARSGLTCLSKWLEVDDQSRKKLKPF